MGIRGLDCRAQELRILCDLQNRDARRIVAHSMLKYKRKRTPVSSSAAETSQSNAFGLGNHLQKRRGLRVMVWRKICVFRWTDCSGKP